MAKRSLKASSQGMAKAKQAFERKGWTQDYLAAEVGLSTRQSIWKFFTGKPIERNVFMEICFALDLDWQEIADLLPLTESLTDTCPEDSPLDDWQNFKHQYDSLIENQCNALQSSFDIYQPQSLDKLYTKTYFLPYISSQKWLEITDLEESSLPQSRPTLNKIVNSSIASVELTEKESKLFIVGKPGSGKTTFLQYLALQCQRDRIFPELIPIFFRLHFLKIEESSSPNLDLTFLINRQLNCQTHLQNLLESGRFLILLDGLDELSLEIRDKLLTNIQSFTETYYKNRLIITSRVSSQYKYLRGFCYVEISDFSPDQVNTFVKNWFLAQSFSSQAEAEREAADFLKALDLKENQGIQELTTTPIFLNFLCSIYYHKQSFPKSRHKLYQVGLEILLVNWDQAKGVNRDILYQNLSLANKIKLLSYIAEYNFQKGKYFFEKGDLLQTIGKCLGDILPEETLPKDREEREEICQGILDGIEVQHGLLVKRAKDIYSFSHLTFQEYLTARKIVNMNSENQQINHLAQVAEHLTEPEWREVILMINTLLDNAADFLILLKMKSDNLIQEQANIKQFLEFLTVKAKTIEENHKIAALRAFYYSLFQDRNLNLALAIDVNLANNLPLPLALDLALARMEAVCKQILEQFSVKTMLDLIQAFDLQRKYVLAGEFAECLEQLKNQLTSLCLDKKTLENWWKQEGLVWYRDLQNAITKHRYLGYSWQFSCEEQEVLAQYYQANQFILECLQSSCIVDPSVAQKIEDSLLNFDWFSQEILEKNYKS